MSSLEDRQNELQNRISQIDAAISALDAEFLNLAAEFHSEDGVASLKQAEQIEQRLTQLRREKAVVIAAQGHTTREQLREKEARAEADRRARQDECRQHAEAAAALSVECDEFLQKCRELLERRASHLHALGCLGANPAILAKLGKSALTRAACFHGLSKYIDINRCAPSSLCTLASTNVLVLGLGRDPPAAVKPNGGGESVPVGKIIGVPDEEDPT
jgi:hypothetical protein